MTAPKVCGMIISLPDRELYESICALESLEAKITVALGLIKDSQQQESNAQKANIPSTSKATNATEKKPEKKFEKK